MRPLIAICGTTGVGKSKLGIELALRLSQTTHPHGWRGARVINADSMQVYEGMDILTNKVPIADRHGIEHLLMSFKKPGEQYVVGEWVRDAIETIEETHSRNQVPIIVGGTAYWIQHLLFASRLLSSDPPLSEQHFQGRPPMSEDLRKSISALPRDLSSLFQALPEHAPSASTNPDAAFSLHSLLATLDPIVAARWHWRDTRKVLHNLRIIQEYGRRASEVLTDQTQIAIKPRYRTLCFWLYAKPSVLNARLDARVNEMIEQGVIDEIRHLRELATSPAADGVHPGTDTSNQDIANPDYTLGIYQSIGYREFDHYLTSQNTSEESYNHAIERMKLSTRQYAKRQILWIRNKLLPTVHAANSDRLLVHTYLLDATELGDRDRNVRDIAKIITEDFLSDAELPDPLTLSETAREMLIVDEQLTDPSSTLVTRRKLVCPVCTVSKDRPVMVEEIREWEAHQKSRIHRRLARKQTRGETGDRERTVSRT